VAGTDGDSHSRGHRLKAKGDKVWWDGDTASSKRLADRGFGKEGPQEEPGLSWGAGRAGQAGKAKEGKGGCMPHPRARSGGLPPPARPGQVPTIQPRAHSTSQLLPGAAVAIRVMLARRERREDAQCWGGVAASLPLGEQPPWQPGPLPQGCCRLPALSPSGIRGP